MARSLSFNKTTLQSMFPKKTKAFFAEVGLEVLDWPARSPDVGLGRRCKQRRGAKAPTVPRYARCVHGSVGFLGRVHLDWRSKTFYTVFEYAFLFLIQKAARPETHSGFCGLVHKFWIVSLVRVSLGGFYRLTATFAQEW
jgi:hypothetical protein